MDKNYDVITFISSYFILRRLRVTNFADINKTTTIFIKEPWKTQTNLKEIFICILYLHFLM